LKHAHALARLLIVALFVTAAGLAAEEKFKPFKLKTPEGSRVALAEVLDRATLVVFFFPSCSYCNASYPGLGKVLDDNRTSGLSVVWINVLPEEENGVADWRRQHGFPGTVLLGTSATLRDYRLTQTPTWYLLDAAGKPLWRHDGYQPGDEAELRRRVDDALAAAGRPWRAHR
jgi:thioredoxin-related protein